MGASSAAVLRDLRDEGFVFPKSRKKAGSAEHAENGRAEYAEMRNL
jgi:hypothetical protein